jgi:hypothetical protein
MVVAITFGGGRVDPEGYKKFLTQKEQDFRTELAKQRVPPR